MFRELENLLAKAARGQDTVRYWEMSEGTFANMALEAGLGMISQGNEYKGYPVQFDNEMPIGEVYLWCDEGVLVKWGEDR